MTDIPEPQQPKPPEGATADLQAAIAGLPNDELLSALDVVLVELERRLLRYAHIGHEILEMANEGLVLAVRANARLGQAQSSATHAASHLQVVGVGEWSPKSTRPGWGDDPRITGGDREH